MELERDGQNVQSERMKNLRFIAKIHRDLHAQRRQYEWKVFFSVLTFDALLVLAKSQGRLEIASLATINFLFVLLAAAASYFLYSVHKSNKYNKNLAQKAEDLICESLTLEKSKTISEGNWAFLLQFAMLIIATIISMYLFAMPRMLSKNNLSEKATPHFDSPAENVHEKTQTRMTSQYLEKEDLQQSQHQLTPQRIDALSSKQSPSSKQKMIQPEDRVPR